VSIILAAVYTLNMIQKVFYGDSNSLTANGHDIRLNEKFILIFIVILILIIGVYPKPILDITMETTDAILKQSDVTPLLFRK